MGQLGRIAIPAATAAAGLAAPVHAQMDEFYIADLAGSGPEAATLTLEWRESEEEGGRFCYAISAYGGLSGALSAHLHRGAGGPMVMEFNAPGGRENASDGCIAPTDGLREEIAADPAGFEADIHLPSGRVTGRLGR